MRQVRRVEAEFDDTVAMTPRAGAVIFERAIRGLGVRRRFDKHLPERPGEYSSADVSLAVVAGLLVGGRGFQAAEMVRRDEALARIFGFARVPEEATVCRAMCDMAGLAQRKLAEAYEKPGTEQLRLDMGGGEKPARQWRRVVPEEPEQMGTEQRRQFDALLAASACRCARSLPADVLSLCGFVPVHVDGTDLEVEGRCFDAARKNHEGERSLRLMVARIGPVEAGLRLLKGASDEGTAMPDVIALAVPVAKKIAGKRRVLALVDAGGGETGVIEKCRDTKWFFLIGANGQRAILERLAGEQPESVWTPHGADGPRKWSESQTAVFTHLPGKCSVPVCVIARRWRVEGELPGAAWHYSFLYTNIEPGNLPKGKVDKHGFALLCWMMYSTKQGHENHFKTLLSDLGAHHPPSGRMGATEAFVFIAAVASHIWSAVRYRVAAEAGGAGIRLWRFIRDYVTLCGEVVTAAGRTLLARLAGGLLDGDFKSRWLKMFAAAGRL